MVTLREFVCRLPALSATFFLGMMFVVATRPAPPIEPESSAKSTIEPPQSSAPPRRNNEPHSRRRHDSSPRIRAGALLLPQELAPRRQRDRDADVL